MLILIVLLILIFPPQAQAYLDPGTGSYITQLLIGGLVGGGYLIKMYFHKIVDFFKKKPTKKNEEE